MSDIQVTSRAEVASVLHSSKAGIVVDVEVSPGAKNAGISSINPWRKRLCISVKAPPKKGEANKEVMALMSEAFGVPTRNVTILSGQTSSLKRVELAGITLDRAIDIVLEALAKGGDR
jgi:hypothetical protein